MLRQRSQLLAELLAEVRMSIDARADSRATLRQAMQARLHAFEARDAVVDLLTPRRQLLADRHRHRIHEMRAARLHDVADFLFLGGERLARVLQRRDQVFRHGDGGADVNRRRNDVVAALAHVDVIVRVHGPTETRRRQTRDHFVRVHVGARARARLEHVDGELRIVLVRSDFCRGRIDRTGDIGLQQIELRVGASRSLFHQAHGADEAARHRQATDREVLHGALGLGAPQGISWYRELTHAVALGTALCGDNRRRHGFKAPPRFGCVRILNPNIAPPSQNPSSCPRPLSMRFLPLTAVIVPLQTRSAASCPKAD